MKNKYLSFYLHYINKYKGRFVIAIVFMFLYAILNTSVIFIVKTVIDDVFVNAQLISQGKNVRETKLSLKSFFTKNKNIHKAFNNDNKKLKITSEEAKKYVKKSLIIISLIFILIYLLKGMFWYIRKYMMFYIGERVVLDIRNKLYTHLQMLSIPFFDKLKTGEMMSRITNDVLYIKEAISKAGTQVIQEPLNLFFSLIVLFYLNWQITTVALIIIIILILPVMVLSKKMKKATKVSQKKIANLSAIMQEIINGIRVVKAFNMEKYEINKFKKVNREYFNAMMKGNRAAALLTPTNEFLSSIAISLAIIIGGLMILQGKMTTGSFFAYFFALFSAYRPTRTLTEAYSTYKKSQSIVDRIEEILSENIVVKEKKDSKPFDTFKEEIVFKNVYFAYEEEKWVLKNVNMIIKKGMTIGIAGESGGGKSTIGALLLRFYDVSKGEILIDGINIKDYKIADIRKKIGYVSQEPFLFNDTIFNNISYGSENVTKEQVIEAAKASNAYDFIMELPNGFDTIIGERGYSLSGGQRQRIAIARALIKNPEILILDEATSALDTESERLVQEALQKLMEGRTNIVIAHRLSTIKNSDIIYVIEKGQIKESGSHNELLKKGGLYYKLYNLQ